MKYILTIIKLLLFLLAIFIVFNVFLYIYAYVTPKTPLKTSHQISFYDKNNKLIFSNINGKKWIEYKDISKNVINSTISIEDKHFFNHKGFDYLRIVSAMMSNIKNRNINQGASTISQQYIKNLYLDFDKNWKRKFEEALLTFEIETHYSKKEILEGYLNTINYGSGKYGIENASKYYFNKSSKDLNLAEATLLVGIPKNPTKYNLIYNYENAKKRQKLVLKSMVKNKYITKKELKKIYNEKVNIVDSNNSDNENNLNYYKDAVLNELKTSNDIPKSIIHTGGIKIYTNLDMNAQAILNDSINNNIKDNNKLEVASLVIEPSTSKIIALIGGRNYKNSEYNRVVQSKRQVGSTIKPFLYYSALENGLTPSSTFKSEKTTFNIDKNKTYSPKNYNNTYANKKICMAAAISFSDNIFAVKTNLFLEKDALINVLNKSGIMEKLYYSPSLALGTEEINMLDYSNAYNTLANYGKSDKPYLIRKIKNFENKTIYVHKSKKKQVLNKKYVFILNEMLTKTYDYNFIDYVSPTMISIKGKLTKKYAIKSGSTNTDFWTIGYNPDALIMVWTGYDNNKYLNSNLSKISKNIWVDTIENILKNKKNHWYSIPEDVVASNVNPISGEIATNRKSTTLYYIQGTEPKNADLNIFPDTFLQKKSNYITLFAL